MTTENLTEKDIKREVSALQKLLEANKVPCFLAYYIPNQLRSGDPEDGEEDGSNTKRLTFNITLPEEISDPPQDVVAQYGRFKRLLQAGVDFDKESFHLAIKK